MDCAAQGFRSKVSSKYPFEIFQAQRLIVQL
jgi:hypothetical protein